MNRPLRTLALAGWGHSPRCWERLAPQGVELTPRALPGHAAPGETPTPGTPGLQEAANALPGDWDLVMGWSLGGLVALEAVRRSVIRPLGLILVATPPAFLRRPTYPAGLEPAVLDRFRAGLGDDPEGTLRRFYTLQFQGDRAPRSQWAPAAIRDRLLAAGTAAETLQDWLDVLEAADLTAEPPALELPVLILHGTGDAVVDPAAVDFFAECGPRFLGQRIEGAGHAPHVTHPEETGQHIAAFARNLSS
ncbi:alpha/beta fold hydrolase [Thiohalorhabdus methylotrophus]|uniref:Alpha/beta fold hydrolase n=1 Tax=Thiohalorhabdus methylotrophus TaxID=3242694 RepID=A0ABV4TSL4_9GAMM